MIVESINDQFFVFLFSFFCGGVFFSVVVGLQFLGCPCTNPVGNLPERRTLHVIAKQPKLTPILIKGPMCNGGLSLYKPCRKSTGKPCNHVAKYFGATYYILAHRVLGPTVERDDRERETLEYRNISIYIAIYI